MPYTRLLFLPERGADEYMLFLSSSLSFSLCLSLSLLCSISSPLFPNSLISPISLFPLSSLYLLHLQFTSPPSSPDLLIPTFLPLFSYPILLTTSSLNSSPPFFALIFHLLIISPHFLLNPQLPEQSNLFSPLSHISILLEN